MRQVLLFDTAIATSNLGDEIIFESTKQGLSTVLDNALVFRLGTHIENYNALQMFRNWKQTVLCERADYKFVCGTNLLSNSLIGRCPQWQLNFFNRALYHDAILVGVGRISDYKKFDLYTRILYKKCLSSSFKHSVRDEETKRVLETLGLKAINTGCPTLWKLTPEFCATIPQQKAKNAVISVSGYGNQLDVEFDSAMIECVQKSYGKIYAWIQTAVDDSYLSKLPNTESMERIYSIQSFADILKKSEVDYIGTRLHGGVYALQHGVRSIVISIDERAEGFYHSNNLPIVRRKNIKEELYDRINSNWKTEIRLDQDAIAEFLNQFI